MTVFYVSVEVLTTTFNVNVHRCIDPNQTRRQVLDAYSNYAERVEDLALSDTRNSAMRSRKGVSSTSVGQKPTLYSNTRSLWDTTCCCYMSGIILTSFAAYDTSTHSLQLRIKLVKPLWNLFHKEPGARYSVG